MLYDDVKDVLPDIPADTVLAATNNTEIEMKNIIFFINLLLA